MSDQPTALQLADELEANINFQIPALILQEVVSELRRLYDVLGKSQALNRIRDARIKELEEQRDALLEALHWIADRCPAYLADHPPLGVYREMAHDAGACARAAIANCEGEKK